MQLELEFFGPLQDQMGSRAVRIQAEHAPHTVDQLIDLIAATHQGSDALRACHVRLALNDRMIKPNAPLKLNNGDRIAFMSPFSGG
ncbi:MoaD/ThiS family protein [Maricaulis sp.]|uniref:MoaD/ThiS family protein n=1 Tax=Maricaulis sp. TaxID=1486257 RepID=UPI002B27577C|nr:MoaD/ThiS family protein [Maricaulis sp.]